jgi:hypothetical protein
MTLQAVSLMFPDTELWATNYLRAALAARSEPVVTGVKVSASVPNPRAARMVVVRRDGGVARGVFDHPRLAVRVWAGTERDAADLSRLVSALVFTAAGDGVCTNVVQLTGPTPVADESDQPLRYLLFELTMRGADL